ncbi:hypothetical protein WBJ53_27415 [Spirosoma sp. SC4-14]|uniref:hypothetical protein n=1 Tax=Spirosoma sp. SC4-14 TaxID=3128900 RepID=UPI0030D48D4F
MNQSEHPDEHLPKAVENYVFTVTSRYIDTAKPPLQSELMDLVIHIDKPHTDESPCINSDIRSSN